MSDPVLQVSDLHVSFPGSSGPVRAVRGVSYELARGEVLGIVGESGSGKSASAQAVMGLLPAFAQVSGSVSLGGQELTGLDDRGLSKVRGERIAMVFQDPLSALTPVYTVGDQIAEAVRVHRDVSRDAAGKRAVELLELVGIPQAASRARAFPHEFSGGMRQRVMIAMAIANDPDVLICDEPTTALDVTIQAQILDLLRALVSERDTALVMITHDLGVVAGMCERVNVMYGGMVMETGPAEDVFRSPRHPYTLGLLQSVPRLDTPRGRKLQPIEGAPRDMLRPPSACPFAPRCAYEVEQSRQEVPQLVEIAPGHKVACFNPVAEDAWLREVARV